MMESKLISLAAAAELIPDEAVVSVSSSSGVACPDAMLKAIGDHFRNTGSPRNLTAVHPIAAGDMYGIDGVNHLAQTGLLKRIVVGSLPSGTSSMESPPIWRMIINDEIEAYNLPSGIIYHMHREAAAGRPGVLSKVGWDTVVDPVHQGGKMNERTCEDIVRRVEFDGDEWLYYKAIPIDVAIIRATTADERGNLSMEHEGSYLGTMDQALAAHNNGGIVIAQVKRMAQAGVLPPQSIRVPGALVDYIVLAPDQLQASQTLYDPAISGEVASPLSDFELVEWGVGKVIARRAAMTLRAGETVNLGFGISALVPYISLEEGLHGATTWVIEQGAVGGLPLRDFAFGCASNPEAIMPSPDQFTFFQGGGFDRSLLSFVEVNAVGSVNVSRLSAIPHITSGIGGFIDITTGARNIVFSGNFTAGGLQAEIEDGQLRIKREGRFKKFVPQIEAQTFSGEMALQRGQNVMVITERCVMMLDENGLTITEIAPGARLKEDVLDQADISLRVSPELRPMPAEIFQPEPMGLQLTPKAKAQL
jgi:acyl CoA:acetate/3-ketoacid CoA transferase